MSGNEVHFAFMREALKTAAEDGREVPVGAVIVRDGQVIARAHNHRETEECDPFGHAEMIAMRQAARLLGRRRLHDCTMYVTLEPCPMCAGAMLQAELKACYFAAFDPQMGCCGSVYDLTQDEAFPRHVETAGGLMEEEARELLQAFFAQKRNASLPLTEGKRGEPEDVIR